MTPNELVGKSYTFDDGNKIEVFQVKLRDSEYDGLVPWVTYHVTQGTGMPQKLVLPISEFSSIYGHLFGMED